MSASASGKRKPAVRPGSRHAAGSSARPRVRKPAGKRRRKVSVSALAAIAAAALILALGVGLPLLRDAGRPSDGAGAQMPQMSFSSCGIDISHNNAGPIVWDSLLVMVDRSGRTVRSLKDARKVYPVKFVFIKASEGASMKDSQFKALWKAAGEHDIQRGAYHFFRSSKDGGIQANNFIAAVGELRHSDLPPVLDIETIHRGCSRKTLNDRALQWLRAIEKQYGCKPIVYTYDDFARNYLSEEIKDNYPVWIAHYETERPVFEDWEYWQFTDRAYVYGMPEPVDLSIRK